MNLLITNHRYSNELEDSEEIEVAEEAKKIINTRTKNSDKKDKGRRHNYPKFGRKWSQKFWRWGRKEDKNVFSLFHKLLEEADKSIEEFFSFKPSNMFDNKNCKIRGKQQDIIVAKLWKEWNWKKEPYFLLKRLLKLYSNQTFSVREIKALKKIVRSQNQGVELDMGGILYNYPGKTLGTLKATIQNILSRKFIEERFC